MGSDIIDEITALMSQWATRSRKAYSQPGQREVSAAVEQCRTDLKRIIDRDPRRRMRKQLTAEDLVTPR